MNFQEFCNIVNNPNDDGEVSVTVEISHNSYTYKSNRYGFALSDLKHDIQSLFFEKFCDINDGWDFDVVITASNHTGVIATHSYSDTY